MRLLAYGEWIDIPTAESPAPAEEWCTSGFGPLQVSYRKGATPPPPVPPHIVIEAIAEDRARSGAA